MDRQTRFCGNDKVHDRHTYPHGDVYLCNGVFGDAVDQELRREAINMHEQGCPFPRDFGAECTCDLIRRRQREALEHLRGKVSINNAEADAAMYEAVNHPSHYGGDTPYEVIKVLEAWDDALGLPVNITSAIKYLTRAGRKPGVPWEQDMKKALWHIEREIKRRSPDGMEL